MEYPFFIFLKQLPILLQTEVLDLLFHTDTMPIMGCKLYMELTEYLKEKWKILLGVTGIR